MGLVRKKIGLHGTDMNEITNGGSLQEWLRSRPAPWAAIVGHRAASRVFPIAIGPGSRIRQTRRWDLPHALYRLHAISTVALFYRDIEFVDALSRAADFSWSVDREDAARSYLLADGDGAGALSAAGGSLRSSAKSIACMDSYPDDCRKFALDAVISAQSAQKVAYEIIERDSGNVSKEAAHAANVTFWAAINSDLSDLGKFERLKTEEQILDQPLWPLQMPEEIDRIWQHLRVQGRNYGMALWHDWYERRLAGYPTGFALPPEQDLELHRRLIAQDNGWWGRGPAAVNVEIQSWLDELTPPKPDPQEPTAPIFKLDEDGRLGIDRGANREDLRHDAAARRMYEAARDAVRHLAERLSGDNQAGIIGETARTLAAALGATLEQVEPQTVVLYTENLRQAVEIQQRADGKGDLVPLDETRLFIASSAQNALNMWIGFDPFLDEADSKIAGPDKRRPLPSPEVVSAVAAAAAKADLIDPETKGDLDRAVANALGGGEGDTRQLGFMATMALNMGRYGVELVTTYPELAGIGAVGSVAVAVTRLGVTATAAVVAGGLTAAYHVGRYFIANEDSWREIFSPSVKSLGNFNRMMALLKRIPLKSLKDD